MREIFEYLKARYLSEKAQGMAEYALVLAFVVVVIAAVMGSKGTLSDAINSAFTKVSDQIKNGN
jgi:pilus assembly protein Flp/PilA